MTNTAYPPGAFFKAKGAMTGTRSKATVRERDGARYCRVVGPGCEYAARRSTTFSGAHITAAGMGGDSRHVRSQPTNIVRCCDPHHTGTWSLHSGHLRIEVLHSDPLRIRTWGRDVVPSDNWYVVHEEAA